MIAASASTSHSRLVRDDLNRTLRSSGSCGAIKFIASRPRGVGRDINQHFVLIRRLFMRKLPAA
jgi:hypothetical protein